MLGAIDYANPINRQSPLNRGLVSWWLCLPQQSRGLYWRDLCRRSDGTLTGMDPATDWQGARGRPGGWGSLAFDGSDDHVTCAANPDQNVTGAFTFSAWVRTTVSDAAEPVVCGKGTYGGSSTGYHFSRPSTAGANDDKLYFHVQNTFLPSADNSTDGVWHLWDGVYTTTEMRLYRDGVLSASTAKTGAVNASATAFEVGRRPGSTSYFNGDVDDIQLRNRALSDREIAEKWRDSRAGYRQMLSRVPVPRWGAQQGGAARSPFFYQHYLAGV